MPHVERHGSVWAQFLSGSKHTRWAFTHIAVSGTLCAEPGAGQLLKWCYWYWNSFKLNTSSNVTSAQAVVIPFYYQWKWPHRFCAGCCWTLWRRLEARAAIFTGHWLQACIQLFEGQPLCGRCWCVPQSLEDPPNISQDEAGHFGQSSSQH